MVKSFKIFLIENMETREKHIQLAISRLKKDSDGKPYVDVSHDQHFKNYVQDSSPETIVRKIAEHDPTSTGEYVPHMVRFYQHPNPSERPRLEDMDSLAIDSIPRDKRKIGQIESHAKLKEALGRKTVKIDVSERNEPGIKTVLSDDKGIKIYEVENAEAMHNRYKKTEWCIAKYHPTDKRNMFNNYSKDGDGNKIPIFTMHHPDGSVYAFDGNSDQFMDTTDTPIKTDRFKKIIENHPKVKRFAPLHQHIIRHLPETIPDFIRGHEDYFPKK